MGKLVVTEFMTLDGVIEDPGGAEGTPHGGWSFRFLTPDGEAFKFEELLASDVQLMGRVTYEGFAAAWPAMEEATGEFGKRMNKMPKVVVSTTLTHPAWNNTTVISCDVAAGVARLKQQYQGRAGCTAADLPAGEPGTRHRRAGKLVSYQNRLNACCRHARIGRSGRVMCRLGQAASRSQVLRRQGCSGVEKAGYDQTMSTDELSFDQRGLPAMSLVRVHNLSVSLDGFSTGADQSLEAPFGHAGDRLMRWFTGTRSFHVTQGQQGGSTGIDDAFASNWGPGIGVEIMGRNKFGPQRGPWTDEEWKGWWGEEPPFHTPVFVLTHHVRPSIEMKGGTTFHFIDASPAQALAAAREAAGGLDVRIGGGPATIRQFLAADLIDHMHIALVPILLGRGESLWDGLEGLEERFAIESVSSPSGVTHVTFTRR